MIDRLLQPLLSLHGWEAYLRRLLVFAEAAIMLGFVFPGETAAILGGVLASKGGVNLTAIVAVVVVCAIVGDSVGYAVGDNWGRSCCGSGAAQTPEGHQCRTRPAQPPGSRRGLRGALLRLPARRGPGLAGLSSMRYRTFLWSNAAGGLCWGVLYTLLGYFVGQRVEKATGIASDVVLGLILVVIVVLIVRHHRRDKEEFVGPPGDGRRRQETEAETAVPGNDAAG